MRWNWGTGLAFVERIKTLECKASEVILCFIMECKGSSRFNLELHILSHSLNLIILCLNYVFNSSKCYKYFFKSFFTI